MLKALGAFGALGELVMLPMPQVLEALEVLGVLRPLHVHGVLRVFPMDPKTKMGGSPRWYCVFLVLVQPGTKAKHGNQRKNLKKYNNFMENRKKNKKYQSEFDSG